MPMLYFVRMFLAVILGVVSVFVLLSAIEFHFEVNETYRHLRVRNELRQQMNVGLAVATQTPDEYYELMIEEIGFRYAIAGIFLACTAATLSIEGQRKTGVSGEARVYGPEDK